MAVHHITVSELKCACLDPGWRADWLAGKKPPTRTFAPPGTLPVYGTAFHQIVDGFIKWLTAARSKKVKNLATWEAIWHELYERFASRKLTELSGRGKVESAHHLSLALREFCRRVAQLRLRTPDFKSWQDVYLANEFPVKDIRFDLKGAALFVSGQLDAVRSHPDTALEIVDYKLGHGRQMKQDLLQICIYARILSLARPGLDFHGTLEYYEPQLHEVNISSRELNSLFDEQVMPVLHEIAAGSRPAARPQTDPTAGQEAAAAKQPAKPRAAADFSEAIQKCFASFKLDVAVVGQHEAPQLIRYQVKPAPGVKVVSLANRADDLRVALALPQPPMIEPSKGSVVIDIPKEAADVVFWRNITQAPSYLSHDSPVAFPIGIGVDNRIVTADFADSNMCHALVAGASGSGKSEFLKCLAASLIAKNSPDTLKLSLIDPKILTFGGLTDIAHLAGPVITDVKAAIPCLREAVQEMDRRYLILAKEGHENLTERFRAGKRDIHFYVIIFDEYADLILAGKDEKKQFENLVAKLAAKGRAAGIHLVLATQRPDRTVLTGLIKSNLPLKVCLKVISAVNSNIVLDQTGAEKLLGRGDLLCDRGKGIERAQSPYITQEELRALAA
ncbi:MAG: DNA translocase FtsK [Desulfobacterales bacterium]|jgi:S-DNA-T family DNA segregation ATPase FtsK/SpoIIIE